MRRCIVSWCKKTAPRNSKVCMDCRADGRKEAGSLTIKKYPEATGGTVTITAGNSTGTGSAGAIMITAGTPTRSSSSYNQATGRLERKDSFDGPEWEGPGERNNFRATRRPGAYDDKANGYHEGSVWADVSSDRAYQCVDATVGASIWLELAPRSPAVPSPNLRSAKQ